MPLGTDQESMLDSGDGRAKSGIPRYYYVAGPASTAARHEGNMRKALVTLSCLGLLAALFLPSSCIVKDTSEADGGGKSSSSGGAGVNISGGAVGTTAANRGGAAATGATSSGGGTSPGGDSVAEECPDLLTTLNPGEPGACSTSNKAASFSRINMLILLDKSGSMKTVPTGYTKSKWTGAQDSLKDALDASDALISYGLLMFPQVDATVCELADGQAAVNVPVGPAADTVPQILDTMAATTPNGGTPTAAALKSALAYYTVGDGVGLVGQKYILLVTDGGPNCALQRPDPPCGPDTCTANLDHSPSACGVTVSNCCDPSLSSTGGNDRLALCVDDTGVVEQLQALAENGIKTFVVGIPGTEVYSNYLSTFAQEGGVPVTVDGKKPYYEVTGESGLTEAFKTITTSLVRSCTVPLQAAPMDLGNINVAVDCNPVPQKSGDVVNWHYDADQQAIVFDANNPQCKRIETSGVKRVDVVLGCPPWGIL
jgi:hypothetical protein